MQNVSLTVKNIQTKQTIFQMMMLNNEANLVNMIELAFEHLDGYFKRNTIAYFDIIKSTALYSNNEQNDIVLDGHMLFQFNQLSIKDETVNIPKEAPIEVKPEPAPTPTPTKKTYVAYIDGSYDGKSKYYSGAVVLKHNGNVTEYAEKRNDDARAMNNVAGELLAMELLLSAIPDNSQLHVFYDYEGIEKWANEVWKAKNNYTKRYKKLVDHARTTRQIKIQFQKVKAHSGNELNDRVDKLAKIQLGL